MMQIEWNSFLDTVSSIRFMALNAHMILRQFLTCAYQMQFFFLLARGLKVTFIHFEHNNFWTKKRNKTAVYL